MIEKQTSIAKIVETDLMSQIENIFKDSIKKLKQID